MQAFIIYLDSIIDLNPFLIHQMHYLFFLPTVFCVNTAPTPLCKLSCLTIVVYMMTQHAAALSSASHVSFV